MNRKTGLFKSIGVMKSLFLLAALCLIFTGCVSKKNIQIPVAESQSHPHLARLASITLEVKKDITYFDECRKYVKRGVPICFLKGDPYEMGYARGMLLKNEIRVWIKDVLFMIKKQSFGTTIGENMMIRRAKEVEKFIPPEYIEELKGLSVGSNIAYDTLLMSNVLASVARQFGCTSVAVKDSKGRIIRSRNLDYRNLTFLSYAMLVIYQPDKGYAFASVGGPASIGILTAMNEKGITVGSHDISGSSKAWKGIPTTMLNRKIIQNSSTINKAGKILELSPRAIPTMFMVNSPSDAAVYEYDSKQIGIRKMDGNYIILTNRTKVINIGSGSTTSHVRYNEAVSYLTRYPYTIDLLRLIELNRGRNISWSNNPYWHNLHSAIFMPQTLDFWIAIDPPPATRGQWIGFNLKHELYGDKINEPYPLVVPAM